jgi:phosphopantothenoylcysteine decarboxylase/phosphopantothenate--cysteine ligase
MGFAIASRAAARGANVTLVAGPVALATPAGVARVDVESADEMRRALANALTDADALVMAAAVADFRPAKPSASKIKKNGKEPPAIALARNADLIAEIGGKRTGKKPVLVAFALETGDDAAVVRYAKEKLAAKKVDVVVANAAHESLGKTDNRVALVDANGSTPFVAAAKEEIADVILDRVASLLAEG